MLMADNPVISSAALGEFCGSPFANFWIKRYTKTNGRRPHPEYRLFSVYCPFTLVIVGLVVFGVTLQENGPKHYNVAPVVGVAIANFGTKLLPLLSSPVRGTPLSKFHVVYNSLI
jgi:hypothetical protein